ncbi:MAG: hypothetical protein Q9185_003504 [Variospora sp. 1 TL-2023]
MAASSRTPGPQPAQRGGVTLTPSPGASFSSRPFAPPYPNTLTNSEKIQSKFDLSIALTLSAWPALTLSVQNSWGGPLSSEKRDWFAGAISDLFSSQSNDAIIDVEYLEEFLLQVMDDEFEVNVEDDSGAEIASKILGLRKLTLQGDFGMVDEMLARWKEMESRGGERVRFQQGQGNNDGEEHEEEDSDRDVEEEEEEDVDMEEAPPLVNAPKEKVVPKVDDEGFTEVVGKKKR